MTKLKKKAEEAEIALEPTEKDKQEIASVSRIIEDKSIAPHQAFGKLTRGQIELIKRTVAKGASDDELKLFIQVCTGARLNPFLRQAHLVPFWDSKSGEERRTIVIGIDGFRAIAEDGGAYAGSDDAVLDGEVTLKTPKWEDRKVAGYKEVQVPAKATVTVWKAVQGQRYPFTASVWWEEVYPGEKKGGQWHVRPRAMISKCAEALALRKGFPKLLSGMYIPEEMDRAMTEGDDERKVQAGFQVLMKSIPNCTAAQIKEFVSKITKSDKYTSAQKAEFLKAADERMRMLPDGEPVQDASSS